jgi:hypothetical protein
MHTESSCQLPIFVLLYPDRPFRLGNLFGWEYGPETQRRERFLIVQTPDLSEKQVYAKERRLVEEVKAELARGRRCQIAFAGFNKVSSDLQAVAIGATNLVFTMLAMSVIDRVGRKTLLLIGSVGTAACLAGVAAIFFTRSHQNLLVWLLSGYIAFFAFSQGAVMWVFISEVFPNRVRAKGQSLGSFSHWFINALISRIFPLLAAASGGYPFVFFSFMMAFQFFVVLSVYPETKGMSLEEMQKRLGIA